MDRTRRVVIIDDLKVWRDDLKKEITKNHLDIEVVGEAETIIEGWRLITELKPNGVFIDIDMPEEEDSRVAGIRLAENIVRLTNPPWIIFFTCHDEDARDILNKFHPIGFLGKPINSNELKGILDNVRQQDKSSNNKINPVAFKHNTNILTNIDIDKIIYIGTFDGKLKVHYYQADKHKDLIYVSGTLGRYEEELRLNGFRLSNQSELVNLNCVRTTQPDSKRVNGKELILKCGCSIPVGRTYYADIKDALSKIYLY